MVLKRLRSGEPSMGTGFERKNLVSSSSDERRGLEKFNIEVICQRMIYNRFHEPKKLFLVKERKGRRGERGGGRRDGMEEWRWGEAAKGRGVVGR